MHTIHVHALVCAALALCHGAELAVRKKNKKPKIFIVDRLISSLAFGASICMLDTLGFDCVSTIILAPTSLAIIMSLVLVVLRMRRGQSVGC